MMQQTILTENYNRQTLGDNNFPVHIIPVLPDNEIDRALKLYDLNLNYDGMQDALKDLAQLAAKVAGTSFSMINLMDSFTQWTVSSYGLPIKQMAREDSICQYTILHRDYFEVTDLSKDDRFKDISFVANEPNCSYYFGIPLQTSDGFNLGSLCLLDSTQQKISSAKIELLQIIAHEMMNRILSIHEIQKLNRIVTDVWESQKKVAHDIRGPLGGIISLAQIISDEGENNQMDQVLEFIDLIHKSGSSLLELANGLLDAEKQV
ncbi:MAG: GAF domain-containing protein [Sediminibacterium sp.]|nr:GAF domain-containing protein [Sediminibacterium sp.]MDP3128429.1 GAF domain-containing protein [Sediminibacterium sp.]